jgi:hypothetical protein
MADLSFILDKNNEAMVAIGNRFVELIKESLKQKYAFGRGYNNNRTSFGMADKIASSTLYNSVESNFDPNTQVLDIVMEYYWFWVDRGRKPSDKMPPIDPILKWTKIRGLPENAAWGIAKNIQKFGYNGSQFFTQVASDKLIEEFELELTEKWGIGIDEFFNTFTINQNL